MHIDIAANSRGSCDVSTTHVLDAIQSFGTRRQTCIGQHMHICKGQAQGTKKPNFPLCSPHMYETPCSAVGRHASMCNGQAHCFVQKDPHMISCQDVKSILTDEPSRRKRRNSPVCMQVHARHACVCEMVMWKDSHHIVHNNAYSVCFGLGATLVVTGCGP